MIRKKVKVILKKKSSSTLNFTTTFHKFNQEIRMTHPHHQPGVVRKYYEQLFNKFPPWSRYGVEACKFKVSYYLYYHSLRERGEIVPDSVRLNYKSIMGFKIDEMTNGVVKHSILAELSQREQGGIEMVKSKVKTKAKVKKDASKKASVYKEKVYETWIRIFSNQHRRKLNDKAIAAEMRKCHPGKKKYTEEDAAGHRSLWNSGKFLGQNNTKPKVRVEQYGVDKPVKKAASKKVVKKKVVKRIKYLSLLGRISKRKLKLRKNNLLPAVKPIKMRGRAIGSSSGS